MKKLMSPFERRAVSRRMRALERTGTNVTDIAEAYGLSRQHCYRMIHELEAWEEANPKEERVEGDAAHEELLATVRKLWAAGTSLSDASIAIYRMDTDFGRDGLNELYERFAAEADENDPLLL